VNDPASRPRWNYETRILAGALLTVAPALLALAIVLWVAMEDFERAATRLEELKNNITEDIETVDKSLTDIEHFLDHAILTNADKKHLKQWERETNAQLKAFKSDMPQEAYEQTFRLLLLKRIREELGVPRLGLFYL